MLDRQRALAEQQALAATSLDGYRRRLQLQQQESALDLAVARSQALFGTSQPTSPTNPFPASNSNRESVRNLMVVHFQALFCTSCPASTFTSTRFTSLAHGPVLCEDVHLDAQ